MNRTTASILSLNDTLLQPGGVPSSLTVTHQQWDHPNVWPPLVELSVTSLQRINHTEVQDMAKGMARNFLRNVLRSELESGIFYEKYNCTGTGRPGGGGEYTVQEGFGWTNGVALSLLAKYPDLASSSSFTSPLSLYLILPLWILLYI